MSIISSPIRRHVSFLLPLFLIGLLFSTAGCDRLAKEIFKSGGPENFLKKMFGGDTSKYSESSYYGIDQRGSITGNVVDKDGKGVAYVTVSVEVNGKTYVGYTDSAGSYTIMGIPASSGSSSSTRASTTTSSISIKALRTGYESGSATVPEIISGIDNRANTIELAVSSTTSNLGTVKAQVVEKSGFRLTARVYVDGSSTLSTYTDLSGTAILQNVPLGSNTIKAETDWGASASASVTVAAATPGAITGATITIEGSGKDGRDFSQWADIEGKIVDKTGTPVFDARVYLENYSDTYGGSYGTPTDHSGRFWMHGLPLGGHSLKIQVNLAERSVEHRHEFSIGSPGHKDIGTITLSDFDFAQANTGKGKLHGEIWSGNSQMGGVKLTLQVTGRTETYTTTSLDTNGRFRFKDVVSSVYGSHFILTAEKEGYSTFTYNSEDNFERIWPQMGWDAGDGMWVRIEMRRVNDKGQALKVLVSGHVWKRSGGGNVGGVVVELVDPKTGTAVDTSTTLSEGDVGRFSLAAATAGTYTLRAKLDGYSTLQKQVSLTAGTQDFGLELRSVVGTVSGTVNSSAGGALSGVKASFSATEDDLKGTAFTATSDDNGKFSFSNVPEGQYSLTLTKYGYTYSDTIQYYVSSTSNSVGPFSMQFGGKNSPSSYWLQNVQARVVKLADQSYVLISLNLNGNLGDIFAQSDNKTGLFGEKLYLQPAGNKPALQLEYHNEKWTGVTNVLTGTVNASYGYLADDVGLGSVAEIKLTVNDVAYAFGTNSSTSIIIPRALERVSASSINIQNQTGNTTMVSWTAVSGGTHYNVVLYDMTGKRIGSSYENANWLPSGSDTVTLNWTKMPTLTDGSQYQLAIEAQNQWGGDYWTRMSVSDKVTFTYQRGSN